MAQTKDKRSGKRGRPAGEVLDGALELPAGTLGGGVHIELNSNREAIVDGCLGVLEYDDGLVRLNTGNSEVKFIGRDLVIRSLNERQAVLGGFILSVEFPVY